MLVIWGLGSTRVVGEGAWVGRSKLLFNYLLTTIGYGLAGERSLCVDII